MGEKLINPIHNVYKTYKKVNLVNPYILSPISYLKDNIIAAYKLSNGIDSKNGYNATVGSAVTFLPGVNGNEAVFTDNVNSFISIPDNNVFSFTDGVGNDKPFSISFRVKLNDVVTDHWLVNKRGATSGTDEWQCVYAANKIIFILFSSNNASYLRAAMTTALLPDARYHVTFTYDGSKSPSGIKIYVDKVLQPTTNTVVGTYTGMPNGSSNVVMGKAAWSNSLYLRGRLDEMYFFKTALTQAGVDFLQSNYYPF